MELPLKNARDAFLNLARTSSQHRNDLLTRMKNALESHRAIIEAANDQDLAESKQLASEGKLSQTLVERL
jgi:gamma-glutamyl phosphate reductase